MKQNLDTLKTEVSAYLKKTGFIVFHGMARGLDTIAEINWDTRRYPDYTQFLDVAKQVGAKLIVFHHREFNAELADGAIEQLEEYGLDDTGIESRLQELRMYDGFTCAIELSFDYENTTYLFELRTEWYDELTRILNELDGADEDDEDDDDAFGPGYYSKN